MFNSLLYGAFAGIGGTVTGGLIACAFRRGSVRLIAVLTSFASGIMLSIVFFDLIPLSIDSVGVIYTVLFISVGILFVILGKLVFEVDTRFGDSERMKSSGIIIMFAIALHNLPEGLIIGAGENVSLGVVTALLIGLHNVPEGLVTACPLKSAGVKSYRILLACFLAGLPTVLGAVLGYILGSTGTMLIAMCAAGAGGAMLYVVYGELIPSMNGKNATAVSTAGIAGIIIGLIMVFLI